MIHTVPMPQLHTIVAPPFTLETATRKVRLAEDSWNSRDTERIVLAYTEDSVWRNRNELIVGRDQIEQFLDRKWARELDYRLVKDLWSFADNRITVRFQYEWHDDAGHWSRSYGNELWEFDERGLVRRREASINDFSIGEADRKFFWPAPGPRPMDHRGSFENRTRSVRDFVVGSCAAPKVPAYEQELQPASYYY